MPLAVNERVELPKGVVRARKGDNIYIQYIVRVYRNEKGSRIDTFPDFIFQV